MHQTASTLKRRFPRRPPYLNRIAVKKTPPDGTQEIQTTVNVLRFPISAAKTSQRS
ncbi:MAG: hypothetical protein ACP5I1_03705 [Candidatus Hinthialibacter sp.]